MKKTLSISTLLILSIWMTSSAWSATFTVDDFESYPDTPALEAAWPDVVGNPVLTLDTTNFFDGTQSMRLDYGDLLTFLGNSVGKTYPTPQNWSTADSLLLWYLGDDFNSSENLGVRLRDSSSTLIGEVQLTGGPTQSSSWTPWNINLSSFTGGNGLSDVMTIEIGIVPSDFGTGTVNFDFIVFDATSAVSLSFFEAETDNGTIRLEWETASETDNAGFHIWRSWREEGPYTQVTETIIPAQGSATWGASYTWVDEEAIPTVTYYYKLEDIDVHGYGTMHGPESAAVPLPCGTVPNPGEGNPWAPVVYLLPLLGIFALKGRFMDRTRNHTNAP